MQINKLIRFKNFSYYIVLYNKKVAELAHILLLTFTKYLVIVLGMQRLRPNEPSVNLSIRLPSSVYSSIKAVASKRNYSCGEIVRQAISKFLKESKTKQNGAEDSNG